MTAINDFRSTIVHWLCNNGFPNIDIDFESDFGYAIIDTENIRYINVGIIAAIEENSTYFEQFLYEYGLEYMNIPLPILMFLHELGHHMTISSFTDEDLWLCQFSKAFDHNGTEQEEFFHYWEMPDEFAANIWLVNYVNNNIEKVKEFCKIFFNAWNKLCNKINPYDLIKEE